MTAHRSLNTDVCPDEIKADLGPAHSYVRITDGRLTVWAAKHESTYVTGGFAGWAYSYRDPGFTGPTEEVSA